MSEDSFDEEYLDDPIILIDLSSEESDYEEDIIKSGYKSSSPSFVPATFFDISNNIELLNCCRPFYIKVVDCDKHPWYYKSYKKSEKLRTQNEMPSSREYTDSNNDLIRYPIDNSIAEKLVNKTDESVPSVFSTPAKTDIEYSMTRITPTKSILTITRREKNKKQKEKPKLCEKKNKSTSNITKKLLHEKSKEAAVKVLPTFESAFLKSLPENLVSRQVTKPQTNGSKHKVVKRKRSLSLSTNIPLNAISPASSTIQINKKPDNTSQDDQPKSYLGHVKRTMDKILIDLLNKPIKLNTNHGEKIPQKNVNTVAESPRRSNTNKKITKPKVCKNLTCKKNDNLQISKRKPDVDITDNRSNFTSPEISSIITNKSNIKSNIKNPLYHNKFTFYNQSIERSKPEIQSKSIAKVKTDFLNRTIDKILAQNELLLSGTPVTVPSTIPNVSTSPTFPIRKKATANIGKHLNHVTNKDQNLRTPHAASFHNGFPSNDPRQLPNVQSMHYTAPVYNYDYTNSYYGYTPQYYNGHVYPDYSYLYYQSIQPPLPPQLPPPPPPPPPPPEQIQNINSYPAQNQNLLQQNIMPPLTNMPPLEKMPPIKNVSTKPTISQPVRSQVSQNSFQVNNNVAYNIHDNTINNSSHVYEEKNYTKKDGIYTDFEIATNKLEMFLALEKEMMNVHNGQRNQSSATLDALKKPDQPKTLQIFPPTTGNKLRHVEPKNNNFNSNLTLYKGSIDDGNRIRSTFPASDSTMKNNLKRPALDKALNTNEDSIQSLRKVRIAHKPKNGTKTNRVPVGQDYSPPVLPIPSYDKTLELITRATAEAKKGFDARKKVDFKDNYFEFDINRDKKVINSGTYSYKEDKGKKISFEHYKNRSNDVFMKDFRNERKIW